MAWRAQRKRNRRPHRATGPAFESLRYYYRMMRGVPQPDDDDDNDAAAAAAPRRRRREVPGVEEHKSQ